MEKHSYKDAHEGMKDNDGEGMAFVLGTEDEQMSLFSYTILRIVLKKVGEVEITHEDLQNPPDNVPAVGVFWHGDPEDSSSKITVDLFG